ncbi:hypothetical protein DPMN_123412 [Dreissena polymorpha]|uniref:Secreted protein n=1 Tax=Dreissena polymorpha TaxID=45954 RepID=A0A9D4JVC0_DREPO|nr:hypothetical protein DPMN_123412 [Dreissena polymorpha]
MTGTHGSAVLIVPLALSLLLDEHNCSVVPPEALETDLMPGRSANGASSQKRPTVRYSAYLAVALRTAGSGLQRLDMEN